MPNWIAKLPDLFLYPVGWWMTATEWIEDHPNWTLLIAIVGAIVALVL